MAPFNGSLSTAPWDAGVRSKRSRSGAEDAGKARMRGRSSSKIRLSLGFPPSLRISCAQRWQRIPHWGGAIPAPPSQRPAPDAAASRDGA